MVEMVRVGLVVVGGMVMVVGTVDVEVVVVGVVVIGVEVAVDVIVEVVTVWNPRVESIV